MNELLRLLTINARETVENIAKMLDRTPDDVRAEIADLERRGVIRGYQAILNEDAVAEDRVTAIIEVKVTPEREGGFNHLALRIARFPEVISAHLVSGQADLLLFVEGATLREVAEFVSEKLAPIPGVTATATSFLLKTYKRHGLLMGTPDEYERIQVSP